MHRRPIVWPRASLRCRHCLQFTEIVNEADSETASIIVKAMIDRVTRWPLTFDQTGRERPQSEELCVQDSAEHFDWTELERERIYTFLRISIILNYFP